MKAHTNGYKENVKMFGRELDSKISYTINGTDYELDSEELNSISVYYEGAILKSVMKCLEIDSNVEIPLGTVLTYDFGVKVGSEYEYINYGNFVVYNVEKQEDTSSYKITCYDKMLYSNKEYENLSITYPISIREYINIICTHLGLTFANLSDSFVNYDKLISNELYLDSGGNSLNYTFRDVLDELAQVTASTICINDDDELEIRYINDTEDTIDEEYLKDINVNFGEKYGPINTVSFKRSSDSDVISDSIPTDLDVNLKNEISISDNQILNGNNRNEFLPGILNQLYGLEYYINDFSSTGITYYDLCDKYNVSIGGITYPCIMFNDEINITQGLEENVYTEMPEESKTDYSKTTKTDKTINRTTRIADKQQGIIEDLTTRVTNVETETGDMYTKEDVDRFFIEAKTGVTNTFSTSGGNNIFRNTGLWFETDDEYNPYEFWDGIVIRTKEENAQNMNALLLQTATLSQEQIVPNGKYTVSFKYKKLIELANVKCTINDIEYTLTEADETEFEETIDVTSQHINIKFSSDINNSCEIYDLMVNSGEVKLAYTQNQNETTTDTVNISKGITITSTDTETTFKANADGIRTFDKNGNKLTEFTDVGMTNKTQKITDQAEIVSLLHKRVGSHVWVSKI